MCTNVQINVPYVYFTYTEHFFPLASDQSCIMGWENLKHLINIQ